MNSSKEIKQAPFASTLMSSIKAAKEYYHNDSMSDAMFFGLSGHAFVVNITKGLGPCAPYNFDMSTLDTLVQENIGLNVFESPSVLTEETQKEVKLNAANKIKKYLDENHLVLLSSYEFQLITDYDETTFYTSKPWENTPSVTNDLDIHTFSGMLDFFTFTKISKTESKNRKEGIIKSLQYAVDVYENAQSTPDSASGHKAYDFWLESITDENAIGHGNWWTSHVWAESRQMAGEYMLEIKKYFEDDLVFDSLSIKYQLSADLFRSLADKTSNKETKMNQIRVLQKNELEIYELLKEFLVK